MNVDTFNLICLVWSIIGLSSFVLLQFVRAPYGRHIRKGWGPETSNNLGWIIMEFPSFLIILIFFLISSQSNYAKILSLLWLIHYFNRTFIYPFRIRTKGKKIPFTIVSSGIFFNIINAFLNGYYLSYFENYNSGSFNNWTFYLGIILFVVGFYINQKSDNILIHLRKSNEIGYKVPKKFLFNYISCPNLLGELIQWAGFAVMAYNFPATCFFIWTAANLIPRAAGHHKWYKENFVNYPKNRKALIPILW